MQNERGNVIRILITNLPAIIAIALMSIALKVVLNYNFILSFIVLAIAYVVLGIIVEMILDKMALSDVKRQPVVQVNKQGKPKIVDLTDEPKKQPARKISTAPYAEYAAERLRKTKLNFNDLLVVDNNNNETVIKNEETDNKVTIINDYSALLKKVKPKETVAPVSKTVSVEKINEEKAEKVVAEKPLTKDTELFTTETSNSLEDFTVKNADDLEEESNKIKNEIDKRLSTDNKFALPFNKKKASTPPETFTFEKNVNTEKEEQEPNKDEPKDIPQDFVITNEKTNEENNIDDFDDISFKAEEINAENDKAVADSELINQLYKPTEVKKKQPFWKRWFR